MILRKCSRSSRSSSASSSPLAASTLGCSGCRLRRSSLGAAACSHSGSLPPPPALSPGHGGCSRSSSWPCRSPLRIALAGGSLSAAGRGGGSGGCALRDTAHVADIPATTAANGRARRARSRAHFRRGVREAARGALDRAIRQGVSREDDRAQAHCGGGGAAASLGRGRGYRGFPQPRWEVNGTAPGAGSGSPGQCLLAGSQNGQG